jgi:Ankyrin repeats (3 copies)
MRDGRANQSFRPELVRKRLRGFCLARRHTISMRLTALRYRIAGIARFHRESRSVMPQSPECLFLLGPQMTALPTALIGEFIDAAVQNPVRAADLLTAHPELINARWLHDETVLHFLAIEGYSQAVQFLAEHGADVNAANEFGDSPLVDVVVLGRADIVDLLLRHGANPNARSETRDSVLHCAVQSGNDEIVALLLAAGADARYRNDLDESVLDVLPAYGDERERMLAALAKYGITPEPE